MPVVKKKMFLNILLVLAEQNGVCNFVRGHHEEYLSG